MDHSPFPARPLTRLELIELQRCLIRRWQRIVKNARRDWEERLSGQDPSDACASVHCASSKAKALRGSGFLKSSKKSHLRGKAKPALRFAH